uniref:NADH-ubiquinone oxidoreductase chain 6 n=1 Tax=Ophionotus victoriae TaxID=667017 RepID=A0A3G2WI75_9ECHI|nr:NADH dehydrogenase subunit 6 [Ophionotus victoriae]AYO99658.1 NADH dehydrogenase subunit 6 [Ophionotus victoriae]
MLELLVSIIVLGSLILIFSGSPYYGLFGVLIQSIGYSLYLFMWGLPFFSLLLVLIYVGGMMVVFLFSTILSAERYPGSSLIEVAVFLLLSLSIILPGSSIWHVTNLECSMVSLSNEIGFLEVFNTLGVITCLVAFILLVALVVVLVVGFEHSQNNLRKL